jgi:precorrin-8X/cobalt-precorrin-8 methylmutase
MEWHKADLQSLAVIDNQIGSHSLSPAEYEIVRQVIHNTADYEYQHLIRFSDLALQAGASAIANRLPIIVDSPVVMAGIMPKVSATFANPVFCAAEAITRPQHERSIIAWGMEALFRRFPEAIAVVGESAPALETILNLADKEEIEPALIIGVSSSFIIDRDIKQRLHKSLFPNISTEGYKGNALVAIAIVNVLLDLAWEAQNNQSKNISYK